MVISQNSTPVSRWLISDDQFHDLYPPGIRNLSRRHWTPLTVAKRASQFLAAEKNARILDIGSGSGKFCLAAACYNPDAFYYGVEQRKELVDHAQAAQNLLGLSNVSFLHANFTQLNLVDYDHFYFYNSFYENLAFSDRIDDSIAYSSELYTYYNCYLYKQLEKVRAGTRLATYHSMENEVPPSFHVVGSDLDNLLKFWIKV